MNLKLDNDWTNNGIGCYDWYTQVVDSLNHMADIFANDEILMQIMDISNNPNIYDLNWKNLILYWKKKYKVKFQSYNDASNISR